MKANPHIVVGDSAEEFGSRFVEAWRRAERGELHQGNAEHVLSFEDFATLASLLTPKRLALLRYVHRHSPKSIRVLAQALGRDYRRVHEDVDALLRAGLLGRDAEGLHADYDTVRVQTQIAL